LNKKSKTVTYVYSRVQAVHQVCQEFQELKVTW